MLNSKTYIKNSGTSTSFVHTDSVPDSIKETKWYADYDGKKANISINTNNNGLQKDYDITLDNNDLINLLNIPSENGLIDKRLKKDFHPNNIYKKRKNSNHRRIEFPNYKSPQEQSFAKEVAKMDKMFNTISNTQDFFIPDKLIFKRKTRSKQKHRPRKKTNRK
jgi:hypothetical protein